MAIEQEFTSLAKEFKKAGVRLSHSEDYSTLSAGPADRVTRFRVPAMVRANHGRVPGWFLAGIWDAMQLPDLNTLPGNELLKDWGFTHESPDWKMSVGEVQTLVYTPASTRLRLQNYSAGSTTDIGTFPTKSLFHAQKLFEENGWFRGEIPIKSLAISDYLIRP